MTQVEDTKKTEKKSFDPNSTTLVIEHLYLGGITSLTKEIYTKYNISSILCCSIEIKMDNETIKNNNIINYLFLPMIDLESFKDKINEHINNGIKFVNKCITNKQNVLVHCFEGKSRSVTIVLAYLMTYQKWTLKKSYFYVKKLRPIIRPNKGFWKILMKLEKQLFNKNSVTLKTLPFGPKSFECVYCNKNCGLRMEALLSHVKRKHKDKIGEFQASLKS